MYTVCSLRCSLCTSVKELMVGDDLISDLPLRVFDNAVLIGVKRLLVDVAKKSMVTNR